LDEGILNALCRTSLTNQIELSLFHPGPIEDGTLTAMKLAGVTPMLWSPLSGGRLFVEDDPASAKSARELTGSSTQ
jgi:predicted oxidoreductase